LLLAHITSGRIFSGWHVALACTVMIVVRLERDRHGAECLWDCEATIKIDGARIARRDAPLVRERIEVLALDSIPTRTAT
jgi:hypothetical protein